MQMKTAGTGMLVSPNSIMTRRCSHAAMIPADFPEFKQSETLF
jgi:hypothetical protein